MPSSTPSNAANKTIAAFGWPTSLVKDYGPWVVLVRPAQPTWGSLVLACTEDAEAFSDISAEAFAALPKAIKDIETALKAAFDYDKINYLMLMMVDPNVHYHVVPRYAAARSFNGAENADSGWPGPPALGDGITLDTGGMMAMAEHLKAHWPG
jgi:diadenosine tetraphosphate (Ap4A) HIT family hydrolase